MIRPAVTVATHRRERVGLDRRVEHGRDEPRRGEEQRRSLGRDERAHAGRCGRCGSRIAVAPAPNGKVSELPRPYGEEQLGDRQERSCGPTFSTCLPYASYVACMLRCRCMTPFGRPVVPDEYNQNAGESADVSATAASCVSSNSDHAVHPSGVGASPASSRCTT
jgi:hypothetical protein